MEPNALLEFVELVANHRSAKLHGLHSNLVEHARRVVKAAGGRLDKIGRYEAGSAAWKPHERYIGGEWVHPTYNSESDTWAMPPR